jgi:hypothetical protein
MNIKKTVAKAAGVAKTIKTGLKTANPLGLKQFKSKLGPRKSK